MYLNIQSLVPKLDLVEGESLAYDILVFSESWLKPEVRDDSILIEKNFCNLSELTGAIAPVEAW